MNWLREKLKVKNSATPPATSENPENTPSQTVPSEWFSIYGHGFHNALYRIAPEQDAFPEYLKNSN